MRATRSISRRISSSRENGVTGQSRHEVFRHHRQTQRRLLYVGYKIQHYKVKRDYLGEVIEAFRDATEWDSIRSSIGITDFVIDVNLPLRNAPNIDELNAPRKQRYT